MAVFNGRVDLKGVIGHEVGIGGQLDLMADMGVKDITMVISSPGGDISSGIELIRAMNSARKAGCKITGTVRGEAQSMAFQVLQSCDNSVMGPADILMAHGMTAQMFGDMNDREAGDKLLACYKDYMTDIIVDRVKSVKPESEVATYEYWEGIAKSNTPVYYLAEEALELGLIDEIEEDVGWHLKG